MANLVYLPAQYAVFFEINGNLVHQLWREEVHEELDVRQHYIGQHLTLIVTRDDLSEVLVIDRKTVIDNFDGEILQVKLNSLDDQERALGLQTGKVWIVPSTPSSEADAASANASAVLQDWNGKFSYRAENQLLRQNGLRHPQLGALHAALAHWTVTPELLATIVMPTGTGKTETMMSLLVNQRIPRLIIAVPTSNLREQIANKFLTLGVLKKFEVVDQSALYPVVGLLEHRLQSEEDAEKFLKACNVIVATMQALNECGENVRRKIVENCSNLFIDEAHHAKADTWDTFRQRFHGKPILQFTATPFRNDGKHIGGKIIYSYPLRKAQEENYFKHINFRPVFTYTEPDKAIAEATVNQLNADRANNFDHLVMARVNSKQRAAEVLQIYQQVAPDFNPVMIHSGLTKVQQRHALQQLKSRHTRIIVCVNMLGEGFDFPELKIAALHDLHMSLAITLQFTGRFTRVSGDHIGEATFIANRARIAKSDIQQQLRALYAEDADWNLIISDLSQGATGEQEAASELIHGFNSLPPEVPIQNLDIKMSTVVYRTTSTEWNPTAVSNFFGEDELYTSTPAINQQYKVIWFVTEEHSNVTWGEMRDINNTTYNLYVIHWNEQRNLIFVNSSNNSSLHEHLVHAVAGGDVNLISGPDVYRAMHGIERMLPTNMGLSDLVSRTTRFMMLMGSDLTEGLDAVQNRTKSKTNIFGFGFENGERASIGCSQKGRIWSFISTNNMRQWVDWCDSIGAKLTDETISTDEIFAGFIRPQYITARPNLVPLAIDWPLEFLAQQEDHISVQIGDQEVLFYDATMEITDHTSTTPIRFDIVINDSKTSYQIEFGDYGTRYIPLENEARIKIGKRDQPLSEWFSHYKPKIYFEQDTFLERDYLLAINRPIPALDLTTLVAWEWPGVNIKKESQGVDKHVDSIQYKVIDWLKNQDVSWDFLFDDDDAGEVADVIAIRMTEDRLIVHLYHCKFSKEVIKGHRLEDFYAVCGQAQKSVRWRERLGLQQLIPHMIDREQSRVSAGKSTRIEKGTLHTLDEIGSRLSILIPEFKVWVVQPGLSKAEVTPSILELLAATSLYLHSTFRIDFGAIVNT